MALMALLARRRVFLGFVTAAATAVLAQPTWPSWWTGLAIATLGEAIRVWAAGHLEKSREVTRSGPYRWTRHPLYAGSCVIAAGVVVAAMHPLVAVLAAIYLGTTITAAIRAEEAFLRRTFGDTYDRYSRSDLRDAGVARRFSLARALANREYRAVLGVFVGFAFLALKIGLSL
jgi:protein-S-isoprenylcysteine O-methyltransferase Ste14